MKRLPSVFDGRFSLYMLNKCVKSVEQFLGFVIGVNAQLKLSYCPSPPPPSPVPPCGRGTLGTVCAESCGYRTMTGCTKLTTNEITLQECLTSPGVGGRVGGLHSGTPSFQHVGPMTGRCAGLARLLWVLFGSFHPSVSRIY